MKQYCFYRRAPALGCAAPAPSESHTLLWAASQLRLSITLCATPMTNLILKHPNSHSLITNLKYTVCKLYTVYNISGTNVICRNLARKLILLKTKPCPPPLLSQKAAPQGSCNLSLSMPSPPYTYMENFLCVCGGGGGGLSAHTNNPCLKEREGRGSQDSFRRQNICTF